MCFDVPTNLKGTAPNLFTFPAQELVRHYMTPTFDFACFGTNPFTRVATGRRHLGESLDLVPAPQEDVQRNGIEMF